MSLATIFQEVENAFRPTGVGLYEKQEAYLLEALVAGVKPSEIEIALEKGAVSIEAKSGKYQYSYLVPLPVGLVDETVTPEAVVEDGILKVSFPKAKAARPMKITVKTV
jgi:HSP20 family molecular chaperone IbpA